MTGKEKAIPVAYNWNLTDRQFGYPKLSINIEFLLVGKTPDSSAVEFVDAEVLKEQITQTVANNVKLIGSSKAGGEA